MTAQRREQLACIAALALLWALFAVLALWAMPTHDDWYQLGWMRSTGGLTLELLWRVARYNYLHANPRLGDVFLLAVNGPRAIHVVLTPAVQLGLLWAAFVVGLGRRPRLCYRDLTVAFALQLMIWLISPVPGVVYFYRPYTTNYLFAFATTLAVVAPYRLAIAGELIGRWWLVPGMLVLGWLAGLSNEHTGPTAIVALVAILVWAWPRLRGSRVWMIAGVVGVVIGYLMLLGAPGQAERYAGRSARFSALGLIASRGVGGNYEILANFIGEAQWAIDLVIAAVLWFVVEARRRGEAAAALPRPAVIAVASLVAAAGAIVVTLFASPVTSERLLFAPAVLLAGALAAILDHVIRARRVWLGVAWLTVLVFGYHAYRFLEAYDAGRRQAAHRLKLLEASKPGTTATVPPFDLPRARWFRGDDFRWGEVRDYVAHEIYGLRGIDIEPRPTLTEATPPGDYTAVRTYDPPLAALPDDKLAWVPAFGGTALMLLRQRLALDNWRELDGHHLVSYRIDMANIGFDDPQHRPIHLVEWTPRQVTFIDAERSEDPNRESLLRVWPASLPDGASEAYMVACGKTTRVLLTPDPEPPHDLRMPMALDCRGPYTGLVCSARDCWLAGRYSR